ncbi:MAG: tryptophan dimethylallyltransferase family protein [Polyangiaceae bacterium]
MKPCQREATARYSTAGAGTFAQIAARQLRALCAVAGRGQHVASDLALQQFLFAPWGDFAVPEQAIYPSLIGDDHSPYEYSLAFGRSDVELRILFEAQANAPSASNNQQAALAFNDRLQERHAVDLSRFERIRDLFLVDEPVPPFSLWHAAILNGGRDPSFKVYLNPAAQGRPHSKALVSEAMSRLGFASAARQLFGCQTLRPGEDEVRYFSLDLSPGNDARVKVYFAHHDAGVSLLEGLFAQAPSHQAGDVRDFCAQMAPGLRRFSAKPLTSCFSFVAGSSLPSAVTLHMPVSHYVDDDAVVAGRFAQYLESHGVSSAPYWGALHALAPRPLDTTSGLQSYASFRRQGSDVRATAYISPLLFEGASRSEARLSAR